MAHNITRSIPNPFESSPTLLPPSVYYFSGGTRGISPLEDFSFTEIDPPPDISGYSIANTQSFYLTPDPQYVISLFLNLPHTFFSEFDQYHQITAIDNLRLDLVAYQYYLNVEYWWIIALANDILDPFNIPIGTILRIPSESVVINEWITRPTKKLRDPDNFFFGTI